MCGYLQLQSVGTKTVILALISFIITKRVETDKHKTNRGCYPVGRRRIQFLRRHTEFNSGDKLHMRKYSTALQRLANGSFSAHRRMRVA